MATTVPAITIQQPWAWAISNADKRIENRRYPTPWQSLVCQPILIHAGRSELWDTPAARELIQRGGEYEVPRLIDLPRGAIVATARLSAVQPVTALQPTRLGENRYIEGPYCLRLSNVLRLERPIDARGRQGVWYVPLEELTEECRRGLRVAVMGGR